MNNSIPAAICRYLKKQHVLSLCAGFPPWCANCFYLFNEDRQAFWLMSEAETRHSELMAVQPLVAGTISGQTRNVMMIKGIQYRGVIRTLIGEGEIAARTAYVRRFPVAVKAKAPIWEIVLNELKMTDNTLGFGRKHHWLRKTA